MRAANALPHTLRYDQLAPYRVPFDELCGGTAVVGELAHWLAHELTRSGDELEEQVGAVHGERDARPARRR